MAGPAEQSSEGAGGAIEQPAGGEHQGAGLFDGLQIVAGFRYFYGSVDGFVQTPSGGEPGTTSHDRPTLSELGFNCISIYDGSISVRLGANRFLLGAQIIRMDGNATLSEDLISQNTFFPAGTSVSSSVHLDWYRLGYEYAFSFDLDHKGNQLRVAPGIQAVLLDFDYGMDAAGGLHVSRSYSKGGVRIGGSIEWLTGGSFTVAASGYWGLPIQNTAQILSVDLVGSYQLWGDRHGFGGAVYLGVGYESIEYEDDQTVPNHIDVNLGPLLIAGIEIRF